MAESFLNLSGDKPIVSAPRQRKIRFPKMLEALPEEQKAVQSKAVAVVDPTSPALAAPSKADLIAQITLNVEAFEPLLGSIVQPNRESFLKSLYSKSEKDLSMLLAVINKTRTLANVTNQLRHTLYMAAQGTEALTSRMLSMKTDGFAQALRTQDEEIRMILREMVMERIDSFQKFQRPEMRLALLFSTTLLATDSANRMKEASRTKLEVKINTTTQAKHSDL